MSQHLPLQAARRFDRHRAVRRAVAVLLASLAVPAGAQAGSPQPAPATLAAPPQSDARHQAIMHSVLALVARQTAALPGRVEIIVTPPDVRLAGAPCAQPEAFLPPGTRIAARLHAGVRCPGEARWSLLVPVTVRQWAPALQASRNLAAGTALSPADTTPTDIDLQRETPGVLGHDDDLNGQVLARALPAGTLLRRDHFRTRPVAQAGDSVTLRYAGAGFVVSAAGKVLQAAGEGQTVRVQADNGRILTGVARSGRIVELGDVAR